MKEESLLLLSDLQKLINQVVLIDYTIIILGGDYFYWDVRDENVYMIYCDDIENPVWVCKSIKAFFELMENN